MLTIEIKVRTHLSGPWSSIEPVLVRMKNFPEDEWLKGFAIAWCILNKVEPLEIRWCLPGGQGHYLDIFLEV